MAIVVVNWCVSLMRVNLQNNSDPYVKPEGKLISLDSDKVEISRIFHCEGLLLCTAGDLTRLVVWNPYTGQKTRWICVEPKYALDLRTWYGHALGYDKSQSYKILRFLLVECRNPMHEIYELNSNSWRVLDVTPDLMIDPYSYGISLKFAYERGSEQGDGDFPDFLICFDFETERFGPRLDLPFESFYEDTVTLSSVREEQLAVLYQRVDTCEIEVWVTTKIESNAVSWRNLLKVDVRALPEAGREKLVFYRGVSFLIDEKRKAVVVIDQNKNLANPFRNTAYIIGENGYYRKVDLGEIRIDYLKRNYLKGFPWACS